MNNITISVYDGKDVFRKTDWIIIESGLNAVNQLLIAHQDALDELTRLREENKVLRDALTFYSDYNNFCLSEDIDWEDNEICERVPCRLIKAGTTARTALAKVGEK